MKHEYEKPSQEADGKSFWLNTMFYLKITGSIITFKRAKAKRIG